MMGKNFGLLSTELFGGLDLFWRSHSAIVYYGIRNPQKTGLIRIFTIKFKKYGQDDCDVELHRGSRHFE
jgi:hypothetical protein